jgi:parvulin-like peptidyl-prolyl isomerase
MRNVSKKMLIVSLIVCLSTYFAFSAKLEVGADKVAKINNRIITVKELEKEFDQRVKLQVPNPDGTPVTKKSVLENMIDDELIKNEVKSKNLVVDDTQVNSMMEQYRQMYVQGMMRENPKFVYNEEEYKNYILREVKISYEKFKEKITDTVLVKKFIEKRVEKKIQDLMQKTYSNKELEDLYDKSISEFVIPKYVELKHIFIRTVDSSMNPLSPEGKATQKKKIDEVAARLAKGEDFDKVCEIFSEDLESRDTKNPGTGKLDRGYLGKLTKNNDAARQQFGDEIFDALFDIPKGKYSKVLESKVGYHVFYCTDKKEQSILPFEEAKSQISDYLKMRDQNKIIADEYTAVIKDLRKKASIEYYKDEYK